MIAIRRRQRTLVGQSNSSINRDPARSRSATEPRGKRKQDAPAHDLGVEEVLPLATHFPDGEVGLVPGRADEVDELADLKPVFAIPSVTWRQERSAGRARFRSSLSAKASAERGGQFELTYEAWRASRLGVSQSPAERGNKQTLLQRRVSRTTSQSKLLANPPLLQTSKDGRRSSSRACSQRDRRHHS